MDVVHVALDTGTVRVLGKKRSAKDWLSRPEPTQRGLRTWPACVCVLDAGGDVTDEGQVPTTPEALRERFGGLPRMRLVLETGCIPLDAEPVCRNFCRSVMDLEVFWRPREP